MIKDWKEVCEEFIHKTSFQYGDLEKEWYLKSDLSKKGPTYFKYEEDKVLDRIPLGVPELPIQPNTIWNLLKNRRSKRKFIESPLTLGELNLLLWGTQGITADMGDYQLRTTPSAGALYPIETYLFIQNVEGLKKGLYHLNVIDWELELLKLDDVSEKAYFITDFQTTAKNAAVLFVWTAILDRVLFKYSQRTYRYIFQDVGHVSQNLHLTGQSLDLGVCTIGHWYDKELHEYLEIDGKNHLSVLLAGVGKVKGEDWMEDRRP